MNQINDVIVNTEIVKNDDYKCKTTKVLPSNKFWKLCWLVKKKSSA